MYNGIGLQTARGSGTSGYVQKNLSTVNKLKKHVDYRTEDDIKRMEAALNRPPNTEILEHQRKRQIEVKCFEEREKLESQGYSEEDIGTRIEELRTKLTEKQAEALKAKAAFFDLDESGRPLKKETHQMAELNSKRNSDLKKALGLGEDFVEGSSFDFEGRAKKRAEEQAVKSAKRAADEAERKAAYEKREEERRERRDAELRFSEKQAAAKLNNPVTEEVESGEEHEEQFTKTLKSVAGKLIVRTEDRPAEESVVKKDKEKSKHRKRRDSSSSGSSSDSDSSSSSHPSSGHKKLKRRRKRSKSSSSSSSSDSSSSSSSSSEDEKQKRKKRAARSPSLSSADERRTSRDRRRENDSGRRLESKSDRRRDVSKSSRRRRSVSRSRSGSRSKSTRERSQRSPPQRYRDSDRRSPSFRDRRRITSARKKPTPYHREADCETDDDDSDSEESTSVPRNYRRCRSSSESSVCSSLYDLRSVYLLRSPSPIRISKPMYAQ